MDNEIKSTPTSIEDTEFGKKLAELASKGVKIGEPIETNEENNAKKTPEELEEEKAIKDAEEAERVLQEKIAGKSNPPPATEVKEERKPEEEQKKPEIVSGEEQKKEEKPEGEPAKKSVLDILKDEPEEGKAEAKTEFTVDSLPDEIKAKIAKADLYEKLEADGDKNPFYKLAKMGATPEEIVKLAMELVPVDNSVKPLEELIALDLSQKFGVEGEELAELVESKMAKVSEMDKLDKKEFELELRSKFKPKGTPDSQFLKQYEQAYQEKINNQPPPVTQEQVDKLISEDKNVISEFAKGIVGAELDGVEITEELAKEVLIDSYDIDEVDIKYLDKDKKLNVKKYALDKLQSHPKMVEKIKESMYNKGREDMLKEMGGIRKDTGKGKMEQVEVPADKGKAVINFLFPHTQGKI